MQIAMGQEDLAMKEDQDLRAAVGEKNHVLAQMSAANAQDNYFYS
jgi:hypothetical protein